MFCWGCPRPVVAEAIHLLDIPQETVLDSLVHGVRAGQPEAAHYVERDVKHGAVASAFNRYHHESLVRGSQRWKDQVREASAQKRGPSGLTPLHCACANPNPSALRQLFSVCPNPSVADDEQRKLAHYAAAAKGVEPLR